MNLSILKNEIHEMEREYIDEALKNKAKRWLADFNTEVENLKQYREREILELLQNADDAGSSRVDIILDTQHKTLDVRNSGPDTIPFKEEGIRSIMCANLSPKKGLNYIGAKGLGFRSILNWSDHIIIRSENVELEFSSGRVADFWNSQMAPHLKELSKYETAAVREHKQVPLSILALPTVRELDDVDFTSIVMHYAPALENQIIRDLKSFQPTSLLFLHNLKSISISVDGERIAYYSNRILADDNGFITSELARKRWISKVEGGKISIDGIEKDYEIGCAYCINDEEYNVYPIYSFFPTRDIFGLPAILHATLELDASRNHLIPRNEVNKVMIDKLADIISKMAEYLKEQGTTWDAYRLMRPNHYRKEVSSYEDYLLKKLDTQKGDYIPLLGGGYGNKDNCWYLDDKLFDIISITESGPSIFSNMRLKVEKKILCLVNQEFNREIKWRIEKFAAESDKDILASLIVALQKFASQRDLKLDCSIFKDDKDTTISGTAFINEGQKVEDIPSFMKFDYLDDDLAVKIKQLLDLPGEKPWQREMADRLSVVGKISSSDISSLTKRLVPNSEDAHKPVAEYKEKMKSLFKIFLKRGSDFTIGEGNEAWLPNETLSTKWQKASQLIAADSRFPDGFKNLGISPSPLPRERCVAYPYYLEEEVPGGETSSIQEFLVKLGVNLYFGKTPMHYGSDQGYINSLDIPEEVKANCSWKDADRDALNTTYIADKEILNSLRLPDLIKLLLKSGYDEQVCAGQQIYWFNSTYKKPLTVVIKNSPRLLPRVY